MMRWTVGPVLKVCAHVRGTKASLAGPEAGGPENLLAL